MHDLPPAAAVRAARSLFAAVLAAALSGCSSIDYYAQAVHGEIALLGARQPIAKLLADPAADPALKKRLQVAQQARAFASAQLDLPRNGSYTDYADLHRAYVVWNVFAAPEFSLTPVTHCFPIAGCVSYLGFFDQPRADAEAARLQKQGYETYVGGVAAFSTLGWFDDPILSTMLRWDDDDLVSTIFHELSHQKVYVGGDSAFNESLATFVQHQALQQWRAARGLPQVVDESEQREQGFTALVMETRARLQKIYDSGEPPGQMRRDKQAEIERLRTSYRALRDGAWHGYKGFDAWVDAPINNARLLPFGLYHRWVPAFAALYAQQGGDWPKFYSAAKQLASLDLEQRTVALEKLLPQPVASP